MKTRRFNAPRRLSVLPRCTLALATAALVCTAHASGRQTLNPIQQAFAQQPSAQQDPLQPSTTTGLGTPQAKPSKREKNKHPAPPSDGIQPAVSIPVAPLGFAPPALFYLGDRLSQVSLNFLDEDTLLFTFRIPGLIPREPAAHGQTAPSEIIQEERNIRALVLSLPTGKVAAEAVWRLHDFAPYLWMLRDRRFLLRDRNLLQTGDAALHLEPFLRFPGPVKYVELDPSERLLVAETVEPPAPEPGASDKPQTTARLDSQPAPGSPTTSVVPGGHADSAIPAPEHQNLLRILSMDDRKVLLFSRTDGGAVHLPLDGDGYYGATRANGLNWLISYRDFSGAENPILQVTSTCYPSLDVLSPGVVLASACTDYGHKLIAFTHDKRRLWEVPIASTRVWPLLVRAANSPRIARACLDITHPIAPTNPLDRDDIRGQTIQVYDVATGSVVLTGPATPVLDGGGGFALSPSGRRFAVLNAGAIQVFDLKAVPPLPPAASSSPAGPSVPDMPPPAASVPDPPQP